MRYGGIDVWYSASLTHFTCARASKSNDIESLNYRLIPANTIYDLYTVRAHTASIDIYIYTVCIYMPAAACVAFLKPR